MPRRTSQERKSFVHGLIFGAGLMLVLILGQQGLGAFLITHGISHKAEPDFALMAQAWDTIQAEYVDHAAVKPKEMTYGAITGMVEALGDTGHSTFLSPQMLKEEEEFTSGRYKGIGAEVEKKSGHVVIVAPFDGSPAQKAGLRPGEIILKVDGKDVAGLSLLQVVRRISGEAGTQVTLTILSPESGDARDVTLTRATISITTSPGASFQAPISPICGWPVSATASPMKCTALASIKNAGMAEIVLDLRNNPGGLLTEAVGVTSQFLHGGIVLQEKEPGGRSPASRWYGGLAPDIPLVVLVNTGTGSAAEILSGALQDARRAQLIGEKTFGTGTVLKQFPLHDGSALLLAIQEWLTPKGRVIGTTASPRTRRSFPRESGPSSLCLNRG